MSNLLPTKFLNNHCVSCGAYNVCDFATADECPTLRLLEDKKLRIDVTEALDAAVTRIEAKKGQPKSRIETSLSRMEKLLDEMEASTKRLAAIIERM